MKRILLTLTLCLFAREVYGASGPSFHVRPVKTPSEILQSYFGNPFALFPPMQVARIPGPGGEVLGGGGGTPAFVQECHNIQGSASTTVTCAFGANVSLNSVIIGGVGSRSATATISSVTATVGSLGTVTVLDNPLPTGGGNNIGGQFCGIVTGAGAMTVQVTLSGSVATSTINLLELSGANLGGCASTTITGHNFRPDNNGGCTSGTTNSNNATSSSGDLLVGWDYSWSDTVSSAGTGYTLRSSQSSNPASYTETQTSSGGTPNATFNFATGGNTCMMGIVSVK